MVKKRCEIRNKLAIIVKESKARTKFRHIQRFWSIDDGLQLASRGVKPFGVDAVSQVLHRKFHELTFRLLQTEPVLFEALEHGLEVVQVVCVVDSRD